MGENRSGLMVDGATHLSGHRSSGGRGVQSLGRDGDGGGGGHLLYLLGLCLRERGETALKKATVGHLLGEEGGVAKCRLEAVGGGARHIFVLAWGVHLACACVCVCD
jgi:hypothetical protein